MFSMVLVGSGSSHFFIRIRIQIQGNDTDSTDPDPPHCVEQSPVHPKLFDGFNLQFCYMHFRKSQ